MIEICVYFILMLKPKYKANILTADFPGRQDCCKMIFLPLHLPSFALLSISLINIINILDQERALGFELKFHVIISDCNFVLRFCKLSSCLIMIKKIANFRMEASLSPSEELFLDYCILIPMCHISKQFATLSFKIAINCLIVFFLIPFMTHFNGSFIFRKS